MRVVVVRMLVGLVRWWWLVEHTQHWRHGLGCVHGVNMLKRGSHAHRVTVQVGVHAGFQGRCQVDRLVRVEKGRVDGFEGRRQVHRRVQGVHRLKRRRQADG